MNNKDGKHRTKAKNNSLGDVGTNGLNSEPRVKNSSSSKISLSNSFSLNCWSVFVESEASAISLGCLSNLALSGPMEKKVKNHSVKSCKIRE